MSRWKLVLVAVALLVLAGLGVWVVVRPGTVLVDGRRVEARVEGTGSPAVVFESGFAGGWLPWWRAQHDVAQSTRTLVYERAGLGRSSAGPQPRSAEQIARELHALLAAEHIPPPYVLVGHSAGGLYVRVFAHLYPQDIAGLVLVDPATEDYYDRMRTKTAASWAQAPQTLQKSADGAALVAQWQALPASLQQARASWPLPAVPTVILTTQKPLGHWPLQTRSDMSAWLESHQRLAARIPASRHVILENVSHSSILGSPELRKQILEVVDSARLRG